MSDENEILAGLESQFDGDEPPPTQITNEMFQRRLVWDVVPCGMAEDVIQILGLPPVSQDVEETEHDVAHERLAALGSLDLTANALAYHIARIQVTAINSTNPQSELALDGLYPILAAGIKGAVAEMLDLGLLHQPHYLPMTLVRLADEDEEL